MYAWLRENGKLRNEDTMKLLGQSFWDIWVTNAGGDWQLDPIPKASRKAIEALDLPPGLTSPAPTYGL